MSSAGQQVVRDEGILALRAAHMRAETAPEYPQASYNRARYYDPQSGRFLNEDPIEFWGGNNFYRYAHNNVNFGDPFGLTDYNQQQTIEQFLQQAYSDATAGYFKGLRNIFHHSSGGADFDFAHNEHAGDTFTVCGIKMSAGDFGNFMAGFQSGAWDDAFYGDVDIGFSLKHLWQLRYAETVARMFGAGYHLKGDTDVSNDRLDKGGMPWITLGADYGRSFSQRGGGCGCLK